MARGGRRLRTAAAALVVTGPVLLGAGTGAGTATGAGAPSTPSAGAPVPGSRAVEADVVIRNGMFLRVRSTGRVYQVVAYGLIYVNSWKPFGGPRPVTTVEDFGGLPVRRRPDDGTFLRGSPGGRVYRLLGGAPVHVSSWMPFDNSVQPTILVNQEAIDGATTEPEETSRAWGVLSRHPRDGTLIEEGDSGRVHVVYQGGPVLAEQSWVWGYRWGGIRVDPAAIRNAGGPPPWNTLRKVTVPPLPALPAELTLDMAVGAHLQMHLDVPDRGSVPVGLDTLGALPQRLSAPPGALPVGTPTRVGSTDLRVGLRDGLGARARRRPGDGRRRPGVACGDELARGRVAVRRVAVRRRAVRRRAVRARPAAAPVPTPAPESPPESPPRGEVAAATARPGRGVPAGAPGCP